MMLHILGFLYVLFTITFVTELFIPQIFLIYASLIIFSTVLLEDKLK